MSHIFSTSFSYRIFSLVLLLWVGGSLVAQNPIPQSTNQLVNDFGGMLSANEEARLTAKLNQYAKETSTQIAIVTEASLQGSSAFDRSIEIAQGWQIGGSDENDNGVLVYIARDDRRIQIQTGYGAEGFLTDALAKRIIDQIITPAFRQGQIFRGLDEATGAIMQLGKGEYSAEDLPTRQSEGLPPMVIFLIILLIFFAISYFNRNHDDDDDDGGYWRNGPYDMDSPQRKVKRRRRRSGGWIFLPGGGGGGFGGGGGGFGGGGGGFGGFGGGDFGGGGAGGGW